MTFKNVILMALYVGLGGFLGSMTRFLVVNYSGLSGWLAILLVNIFGCLMLGFVSSRYVGTTSLIIAIGFLGSLTTFSTFIENNYKFLLDKEFFYLSLNIFLQIIIGLFCYRLGLYFHRIAIH